MNSTQSESVMAPTSTSMAKLETDLKIVNMRLNRLIEEKTNNYIELFKANVTENEYSNFDPVLRS